MTPDIHALIVDHEQTSKYFLWGIEVYTIAMGDMNIIFHISRSFMVVTNEWARFRLSLFTFSWTVRHLLINYEYWWIKICTFNCCSLEKRFFSWWHCQTIDQIQKKENEQSFMIKYVEKNLIKNTFKFIIYF